MTNIQIVIASTDNKYNQMMASRLRSMLNPSVPVIAIIAWSHDNHKQVQTQLTNLDECHLIVFTSRILIDCNNDCESCRQTANCPSFSLREQISANSSLDSYTYYFCSTKHLNNIIANQPISDSGSEYGNEVYWPATASELARRIISRIKLTNTKDIIEVEKTSEPEPITQNKLCMFLQFNLDRSSELRQVIRSQIKSGQQVYYLPLMPGFCMNMCTISDLAAPNLTELFLSLHQQCPPKARELGVYMQMHPDGYLQFRAPERSDDIVNCEPDYLRQLVRLVKEKLNSTPTETVCWLDCRYMPMSTTRRLAVNCDCLILALPDSNNLADITARKEAGLLLASLPNTCHIYENFNHFMEEENDKQTK